MKSFTKSLFGLALVSSLVLPLATFAQTGSQGGSTGYGTNMPNWNGSGTGNSGFCYTFSNSFSSNGVLNSDEVTALNKVLSAEGFATVTSQPVFSEQAVKNFQAKYSDEILKPIGLSTPTGFVGAATRSKLNKLYGCKTTGNSGNEGGNGGFFGKPESKPMPMPMPPVPVNIPTSKVNTTEVKFISPAAGEGWYTNQSYKVSYDYDAAQAKASRVIVYLTRDYPTTSAKKGTNWSNAIRVYTSDVKSFSFIPQDWMIQGSGGNGDNFRLMVMICSGKETCTVRGSSGYFSIKIANQVSPMPATKVNVMPASKADVTGNGIVDANDAKIIISDLGACSVGKACPADVNSDGVVNASDFGSVTNSFDVINLGTSAR